MKQKSHKLIYKFLSFTLAFLVLSSTVLAVDLPVYRAKISGIRESIDILIYSGVEETNLAENLKNERVTLKNIRANLPVNETVEWQGTSTQVENGWLLEKLKAFEENKNPVSRRAILTEASERLEAIEAKLGELETAARSTRTKDEEKRKLAEILRRVEYQKPEPKKENFLQRWWREFWDWVDKIFPRPKLGEPSTGSFQSFSSVLQIIVFALVLGIIGFLLYRFAPFLRARFGRREKKDKGGRVVLGEQLAADATSQNLFDEAEKLAREGNLRAAIRKGYIALLCELSDRKIIGLARHKTNRDYLRDVGKLKDLHQNMSGMTGSFERHWYGFSSPDQQDWEDFRRKYEQTVSKNY